MIKNLKKFPFINRFGKKVKGILFSIFFPGSEKYWKKRYASGGNSGPGSYNKLAEFKAEVLNNFVKKNGISTIIEFGCGDGNQLRLAMYPHYIGFDISSTAIELCQKLFKDDRIKKFILMDQYKGEKAQLTLSLDVIYHLVEDDVFHSYMQRLFASAERFVIIYSSDTDETLTDRSPYIKQRKFSTWVEANQPNWELLTQIPNRYPFHGNANEGSFADFYIYKQI